MLTQLSLDTKREDQKREDSSREDSNREDTSREDHAAVPIDQVQPVVRHNGLGSQLTALAKYMVRTEVHTYAFSVAANVILSLFPFIVMVLTISRLLFHSQAMWPAVEQVMTTFLPSNQHFIMSWMEKLAHPHKSTQVYSVVMLLISSTGVFMPLEVALNGVWGVRENRSYLRNQAVSLGLAIAVGVLAMASVAMTAGQDAVLTWIFFGHVDNIFFRLLDGGMVEICAVVVGILLFFLIYWILPNRKIPARAVLPTAIVVGLLWEVAKYLYVLALPRLDFASVYGPFYVSVGLMIWAFLSGLLLLAGAHFSATRYALAVARQDARQDADQDASQDANQDANQDTRQQQRVQVPADRAHTDRAHTDRADINKAPAGGSDASGA